MHQTEAACTEETNGSALIHTERLVIPQSLSPAHNGGTERRRNLERAGSFKVKNKDTAQS